MLVCAVMSETSMDVSDVLADDFRFSAFDFFYSTLQSKQDGYYKAHFFIAVM